MPASLLHQLCPICGERGTAGARWCPACDRFLDRVSWGEDRPVVAHPEAHNHAPGSFGVFFEMSAALSATANLFTIALLLASISIVLESITGAVIWIARTFKKRQSTSALEIEPAEEEVVAG